VGSEGLYRELRKFRLGDVEQLIACRSRDGKCVRTRQQIVMKPLASFAVVEAAYAVSRPGAAAKY
jgi:bacterioferritin-associated ferredoxin